MTDAAPVATSRLLAIIERGMEKPFRVIALGSFFRPVQIVGADGCHDLVVPHDHHLVGDVFGSAGDSPVAERRQPLFHVGRSEVDVVCKPNDRRARGGRPEPIVRDDETFHAGGAQAGDFRDQSLPAPLSGAKQERRGDHHHQQRGEREAFGEFDHAVRIAVAGALAYLGALREARWLLVRPRYAHLLRLRRPCSRWGGNRGYPSLYLATMPQHQQSFRFSLRRLLAVVVVVAAVGAVYVVTFGRSPVSTLFGGAENIAIVRDATRVEAYRVVPPAGSKPVQDDISRFDFKVAAGPTAVPEEMAKELAVSLLSPGTYRWWGVKDCGYRVYGVKLSFFRGKDRVDVFFCFQCGDLAVTRDGKTLGIGDFDEMKRPFVQAVKKLFPDDAEIQALRE